MKHCPKCGSANITFPAFYHPSIWKCLDCGYEGAFIIENELCIGDLCESSDKWWETLDDRLKPFAFIAEDGDVGLWL